MSDDFHSVRGQLVLDSGQLSGSFFHRSVVLICQHDAEGAFGLTLNRQSENKVGEALVADLPDTLREAPLFVGGPVQTGALSFLHADEYLPQSNVLPNLSLGHSLDDLVELGQSFSPTKKIRVFAGYAGWAAGQLEEEIKRGAWILHPASLEWIFQPSPATDLWRDVLRRKGGKYRLVAQMPDDLSWN